MPAAGPATNELDKTQIFRRAPRSTSGPHATLEQSSSAGDGPSRITPCDRGAGLCPDPAAGLALPAADAARGALRRFRHAGAWGVQALDPPRPLRGNATRVDFGLLEPGDGIARAAARYRFREWPDPPERVAERPRMAGDGPPPAASPGLAPGSLPGSERCRRGRSAALARRPELAPGPAWLAARVGSTPTPALAAALVAI